MMVERVQSEEERRARRALAEANLTGPGLVAAITSRVSALQIDEQRAFISKIASLLSASILGTPASPTPTPRRLKGRLMGVVKASRQSARLLRLRSSFSSSRRSQAAISVKLGFIKKVEDFNDDTLLAYLQFFREPMPPENIAKLAEVAGLSSPSQLRLPDAELQAILEELSIRAT